MIGSFRTRMGVRRVVTQMADAVETCIFGYRPRWANVVGTGLRVVKSTESVDE